MSSEPLNSNERDGLRRDLRLGALVVLVASALLWAAIIVLIRHLI